MTSEANTNGLVLNTKALDLGTDDGEWQQDLEHAKAPTPEVVQPGKQEVSLRNNIIGFLLSSFGGIFIASGTGNIQLLRGAMPDFHLTALRTLAQALCAVPVLLYLRTLPRVPRDKLLWLLFYCTAMTGFNMANYIGVRFIAAGVAGCIRRTMNLTSITILAIFILKEKLTYAKLIAVLISIVGVVVMIQPWYVPDDTTPAEKASKYSNRLQGFLQLLTTGQLPEVTSGSLYKNESSGEVGDSDDVSGGEVVLGYILSAVSGLCITLSVVVQRWKLIDCSPMTLCFWSGIQGVVISLPLVFAIEELTYPEGTSDILNTVGQSMFWGLSAVLGVQAYGMASPFVVTLAQSMAIVFLLIGQYTVLKNVRAGIGNWEEVFGACLVILSAVLLPVWEIIAARCKPPIDCGKEVGAGGCGGSSQEYDLTK